MEKLRSAPSSTEVVRPVSYLEVLAEEQAAKILRSLGEGAVVKTAFEELAETDEAKADNEVAQRIMSGPTNYTMPEGDPDQKLL